MRMTKSILKSVGFTTLSILILAGCASRAPEPRSVDAQCVQACQASYTNALTECRAFVAPITAQSSKDAAEATCLRKLGYPNGSQTCAARCG